MVVLAVVLLAAAVTLAFIAGVRNAERSRDSQSEPKNLYSSSPPSSVQTLPKDYSDIDVPQPEPVVEQAPPIPATSEIELELAKQLFEESEAARTSAIFFDVSLPPSADTTAGPTPTEQTDGPESTPYTSALRGVTPYLGQPYRQPQSPYELKAGSVIPAALVTAVNSDLPGDVVARVTEPVMDTLTGRHVLVPAGAVLYGAYDDVVENGQDRALLVWQRLVMPNNHSINLLGMAGVDARGQAGVKGNVDHHLDQLIGGVVLSTILSFAGNLARSPDADRGYGDVVGDTVAQEGARVGQRIVERQMNVRPTITVPEGTRVNVLVNKDIVLGPYPGR
jgi:type IV secretory pathway VirB10-like protein